MWISAVNSPPTCCFVSTLSEKYCACETPCFSRRRLLAHLVTVGNQEMSNWAQTPKESEKNNLRYKQTVCLCGLSSQCVWCAMDQLLPPCYLDSTDDTGSVLPETWHELLGNPSVPMPRVLSLWLSAHPNLPAEPSTQRLARDAHPHLSPKGELEPQPLPNRYLQALLKKLSTETGNSYNCVVLQMKPICF